MNNILTDWMWCYENPRDAASEIDRLKAALRQIADDPNRDGQSRNIAGAALMGWRHVDT